MNRPDRRPAPWPRAALIALVGLAGCGLFDGEEPLEGERIRIRPDASVTAETAPVVQPLPPAEENAEWTQTGGNARHNLGHLAGPASLNRVWTADAGDGGDEAAMTSRPIIVGGTVYTLDATATVSAFDAGSGARRWQTSLAREGERGREGFGGGLAAAGGRLYAATGFGEVLALDPASGEIVWRKSFGAPFRAAPAVDGGVVVAITRDNRAFGLSAESGETLWRLEAAASTVGLLGGSSPAVTSGVALLPFASGELVAVSASSGRRLWSTALTGGRRGLARASITDISGDPVIVGPYVIAANQAGRMVAIDGRNGQRVWSRSIGSAAPLWPAGDSLFLVSDDAVLMRLSLRDGSTLWSTELPAYRDPDDRKGAIAYSGPVLVGGRVLITDGRGNLIAFDGETGEEVARTRIGPGSITGPAVANGTVYVLGRDATLYAFR
jgi:outer membrane protein assembly factor BamB